MLPEQAKHVINKIDHDVRNKKFQRRGVTVGQGALDLMTTVHYAEIFYPPSWLANVHGHLIN